MSNIKSGDRIHFYLKGEEVTGVLKDIIIKGENMTYIVKLLDGSQVVVNKENIIEE
jgi:exonuclease VII large subunit